MEYSRKELLSDFTIFADEIDLVDSSDANQIIDFCIKIESYLFEHKYVCRHYELYKDAWYAFEKTKTRNISEKTLYELLVYLTIYSREEHASGNYGNYYIRGFQSGTIPVLLRGIVSKLSIMANIESNMVENVSQTNISGEYFVAAELSRRGYITSLKAKRSNKIDILTSDRTGRKMATIQVVTCNNSEQLNWKIKKNVEDNAEQNLFFVFVNLNSGKTPFYYIVPSIYVAYRSKQIFEEWACKLDKKEKRKKRTKERFFEFLDEEERIQYLNAWNILGI